LHCQHLATVRTAEMDNKAFLQLCPIYVLDCNSIQ